MNAGNRMSWGSEIGLGLCLVLGLTLAPLTAGAVQIGFEPKEGYSIGGGSPADGNLVGQPSSGTQWTGSTVSGADQIRVVVSGTTQCLQTVNTGSATAPFYKFSPGVDDLGGTFNASTSLLVYSFRLRMDDAPGSGTGVLLRPRIGEDGSGSPVAAFELLNNGKFNYNDGPTTLVAKTAASADFVAPQGVYFTVAGVVNYANNTYTVAINGVPQKSSTGSAWLGFKSSTGKTANFTLRELASGTTSYKQVSFDGLSLALGARLLPEVAESADAFATSIGVNTHLGQVDTANPYSNAAQMKTLLVGLGLVHLRDNMSPTLPWSVLDDLYNTAGIGVDVIGHTGVAPSSYIGYVTGHPCVEALEGYNEPDVPASPYTYGGYTDDRTNHVYSATRAFFNDLSAALAANTAASNQATLYTTAMGMPAQSPLLAPASADYAALHTYPNGYLPTQPYLDSTHIPSILDLADVATPGGSFVTTETGYHTASGFVGYPYYVSEAAQAKYIPRDLAELFNRGSSLTYFYELIDQGANSADKEQNYGLVRHDFSVKPSYTAIKNLIGFLKESAWNTSTKTWSMPSLTPGGLDYVVTGDQPNIHHTLLQKSDGSFWLLIWKEVSSYDVNTHSDLIVPATSVTLNFNVPLTSALVYKLGSTTATRTIGATSSFTLDVLDEIQAVKLVQGTSAPTGVSVSARQPRMSGGNGTPGIFTLTRTGSTGSALTVNFTVGGSAVSGTDYTAIGSSATILAGNTSVDVPIYPLTTSAQGTRKVVLQLASGSGYTVGSPSVDMATLDCGNGNVWTPESGMTGWTSQTYSTLNLIATAGSGHAIRWVYADPGATDNYHNSIFFNLPAAQDWSAATKLVIHFAEDSGNPASDMGMPVYFDYCNNGVRVSGTASSAVWSMAKRTDYRTIELSLGDFTRNQVTQIMFFCNGNQFAAGNHTWYIDSITVK